MSEAPDRYRPNVAVIVTDGFGMVLICKRAWTVDASAQTVQGGIDAGESPAVAAARELKEELGLQDGEFEMLGEAPGTFRYDWSAAYIHSLMHPDFIGQEQRFFLARVKPNTIFRLDQHGREFSGVHWAKPQELLDQAWAGKKPGIEAALRHFGLI